jgi:acyl dehydratase
VFAPAGAAAAAESHFPVPVVVAHGVLAFSMVTLVLLAVLGVGGG